jgi:hypothetical protein
MLQDLHSTSYSKTEIDTKLDALEKTLTSKYESGDVILDGKLSSLTNRVKSLEDRVGSLSPWYAFLVALASAAFAGLALYRGYATRKEDLALRRRDITRELVSAWDEKQDLAAHVSYILLNLSSLYDENGPGNRLRVIKLGNWFNALATNWKENDIDKATLSAHGMDKVAVKFWQQFQNAIAASANQPENDGFLSSLTGDWPSLAWLVSQVAPTTNAPPVATPSQSPLASEVKPPDSPEPVAEPVPIPVLEEPEPSPNKGEDQPHTQELTEAPEPPWPPEEEHRHDIDQEDLMAPGPFSEQDDADSILDRIATAVGVLRLQLDAPENVGQRRDVAKKLLEIERALYSAYPNPVNPNPTGGSGKKCPTCGKDL